ncbi:MAG: energy-coupling factor transporter ATPase, partial [Coriobacteriia bacterium]|nr:energy-coupling factor transporter ATPase [Coriobacteriia bacterium]MCL2537821.1 energy-coupling factor transporter ATPase [Coriobacteriia bacterium]
MLELTHIACASRGIRDVSFTLRPGQRLALVGANGSGKSSLLHAIVGLQALSGGQVRVDGLDPFDSSQAQEVRRLVGYVQQRPDDQIVATSVEDDVAFGPENLGVARTELRTRVDEALARVGLTGLENREPHTLSGGQKQRLVIAGALALHPNYLVLDEPTAQLDPAGRESVLDVLAKLQAEGTGIVYVTHDISEMQLADRIAVLYEGSIVFEGSWEELQSHSEHFDAWGIDSGLAPVSLSPFAGAESEKMSLVASDLALSYKVGAQVTAALKQASLEVSSGELIVIRGDTGSGKSTLLSILANLAEPDTGEVAVLEMSATQGGSAHSAAEPADSSARLVFQDPELQLFSETVLEDVAFGPRNLGATPDEARAAARTALKQVGLSPDDFGERSPFLLSGGQARRAAIAGIVAMKPAFFLADEPTSALDAQGRDKVRALIASLTASSGVIVVTHNPEQFADIATRTYTISDGILRLESTQRHASDSDTLTPKAPVDKSKKRKSGIPDLNFSLFVPGDTIIHRLDPRTKIIAAALLIASLFSYLGWIPILAVFVLVVALTLTAKVPLGPMFKMLKPLSILITFTLIIHSISWQPFGFSLEGFGRGGLFTLRLVDVMMLSLLVTLTTSPVALTDGLTLLMRPLRRLRVPIDDIAMMLSIALRFIPTIMEEAMTIVRAQTARGAPFNEGKILTRLKAWVPVIIPLLVQLFRRADTLALAMEARCYVVSSDLASGAH